MSAPNYSTINENTPLSQQQEQQSNVSASASAADIPYSNPATVVTTVFGRDYPEYSMTEKAAVLITTNRRKRPIFSLFLGIIFALLVIILSLSLIRGYSDYSAFRATHDIPRRVNVTAMVNGEYYYSYASDYYYSTTSTTTAYDSSYTSY
ncbi:uncharacterized protein V1516DRAFT_685260 [Lipomyces oligophaga]|uniref:uncharacterized protein n=1 Tax=Lipomyces oligophaga TaxID=45792 RepID=UPI0034CEEEBE